MCIHISHTACKLFKDTRKTLGCEKCFVSKGYHNIQTYLPFLVQNETNSSWNLRYSLHVGFRFGKFLSPFPGTCATWLRQSLHSKKIGVDPGRISTRNTYNKPWAQTQGRLQNLQRRKVEVTS